MWRPKGFDAEQVAKENMPLFKWGSQEYGVMIRGIEVGADAMFNALRREGNSRGGRVENDPIRGTGTWLFMPEVEEVPLFPEPNIPLDPNLRRFYEGKGYDVCPACGGDRKAPALTGCPNGSHYGTFRQTEEVNDR